MFVKLDIHLTAITSRPIGLPVEKQFDASWSAPAFFAWGEGSVGANKRAQGQGVWQLENVAIANALQLEGHTTSRQSFWAVLARFLLRMHTNCYFRASLFKMLTSPLDSETHIS